MVGRLSSTWCPLPGSAGVLPQGERVVVLPRRIWCGARARAPSRGRAGQRKAMAGEGIMLRGPGRYCVTQPTRPQRSRGHPAIARHLPGRLRGPIPEECAGPLCIICDESRRTTRASASRASTSAFANRASSRAHLVLGDPVRPSYGLMPRGRPLASGCWRGYGIVRRPTG